MIGIRLGSHDSEALNEFFELFKTPWEPFVRDRNYSVAITDEAPPEPLPVTLTIIFQRARGLAYENGETAPTIPPIARVADRSFPIYTGIRSVTGGFPAVTIEGSGECVGSRFVRDGRTVLHLGYDFIAEIAYLIRQGQPVALACYPTLDVHIANLRQWILQAGAPLVEIPPAPYGHRFFACLTHDVDFAGIRYYKLDRTVAGFLYRATIGSTVDVIRGRGSPATLARNWFAALKLPFVRVGLAPDFWRTFSRYLEIEDGAPSTFFFVPFQGRPGLLADRPAPSIRAVRYDVADLSQDIRTIQASGGEVAVHGIDSWIDSAAGIRESDKVRSLTGQRDLGVRMHWLYFSSRSVAMLEKAGYSFDSTAGYNETVGYKAGTAQVYRLHGATRLLELPMHIMDTALFYPKHLGLTRPAAQEAIRSLVQATAPYGGVLTLNWHDRSIAPERCWDDTYRYAIAQLRQHGAHFVNAGSAVDWFRKRRSIAFESLRKAGSPAGVAVDSAAVSPSLRMVARVYAASVAESEEGVSGHFHASHRDIILGSAETIVVP